MCTDTGNTMKAKENKLRTPRHIVIKMTRPKEKFIVAREETKSSHIRKTIKFTLDYLNASL